MLTTHPLVPAARDFAEEIARHSGDETKVYKTSGERDLLISFYYPAGYDPGARYPLLVFVHGGGWQGRKIFPDQADWAGDYLGFLARYYANRGWLCASIDYRLMQQKGQQPGFEMMDLFEDCMDALEYIKDSAEDIGADLDRTAVLGESAGGHLAAMLITQTDFFRTGVLVNPVTDFTDPRWNLLLPERPAHPALRGMSAKEVVSLFSPLQQVRPGICPALILHGAADSVVEPRHSTAFHERMLGCGNEAQLHFIADTNHAFLLAEYMQELNVRLDAADIAVGLIDQWLNEKIG